jgi:hypothetical protein
MRGRADPLRVYPPELIHVRQDIPDLGGELPDSPFVDLQPRKVGDVKDFFLCYFHSRTQPSVFSV